MNNRFSRDPGCSEIALYGYVGLQKSLFLNR